MGRYSTIVPNPKSAIWPIPAFPQSYRATSLKGKTRQNAENKQTFDLTRKQKIEIKEKLVKTLKINKLLI